MLRTGSVCLRPDAGVALRDPTDPSRRRPLPAPCTATSASPKCCTSIRARGQYIAGGYSYPIRTGDILLYNQGDLHEVTSSLHHEIGTFCFGISGLHLRGLPEGHFTRAETGFVRPAVDEIDHIQSLCEMIYEHAERRTGYSDEIVSHLLPALVLLAASLPPDARAADQPHNLVLANRIRQYIGTHFTEQLTLEDIGEALSMSPYHLAHIFKDMTGMSPIHYMIRCRIGEAQNLLISTDYSATQIAAIVGYTNVNHFNAIFAKLVGLPPIATAGAILRICRAADCNSTVTRQPNFR